MDIQRPGPEPVLSHKILLTTTKVMFDRLGAIAEQYGISRNELMRQLLTYALDELQKKEDTARDDRQTPVDQPYDHDDEGPVDDHDDEWPIEGPAFYANPELE